MGWSVLIILLVLLVLVLLLKPRDKGGDYDPYFSGLNSAFKGAGLGTGRIMIDLDRLDHNLAVIQAHIPSPDHYRIVVKSLPCLDLLKVIQERVGTRKFLVVHRPFLKVILANFGPGIDIQVGKILPVQAACEFFAEIDPKLEKRAQVEICWLVDCPEMLREYLDFARAKRLKLKIGVEIDIGLHRGGTSSKDELDAMLCIFRENPGVITFSGFLGYEGHAAHAPGIFKSARKAALTEFDDNMRVYQSFIDHGRQGFSELFTGDLVFNSGGSSTYSLFDRAPFITDIGIGGAVLRPAAYPAHFLYDLQPAEFIATPVLKILRGTVIPFLEKLAGLLEWWDPNLGQGIVIYGGGWAGELVAPKGLSPQMLVSDPPNQNLVPNESTLSCSKKVNIKRGDYVFYHPTQSDAMFQFEDILLIRGGKVTGTWKVFDQRY
jgi:D-serine deaminase-like pyridoxal phosphate-dependent protein